MPFEGKGTDVDADITQDTSWDLVDSPIRVNPSGDYLSVNANLNIEAGVVVQVAQGKGISFDGACDKFTVTGNDTDGDNNHVLFEGQNGQTWKGIAFTDTCGVDANEQLRNDRHEFSYVDFANTTDYAIAAGSRHGANPTSNDNVGNFTMDHVTFTNVKGAVSHGSGKGTVFDISNFEVNDASESCFIFPEDAIVTLYEGEMDGCNSDNSLFHGAIGDTKGAYNPGAGYTVGGSLTVENVTIVDSERNLIQSMAENIYISNVSATITYAQPTTTGYALRLLGTGGSGTHSAVVNNVSAVNYYSYNNIASQITAADYVSVTNVNLGTTGMHIGPIYAASPPGASGENLVVDGLSAGSLDFSRAMPGTLENIDLSGDLTFAGNSPSSAQATYPSVAADGIAVAGCSYNLLFTDVTFQTQPTLDTCPAVVQAVVGKTPSSLMAEQWQAANPLAISFMRATPS